jgi:hypothetical protein
MEIWYSSEKTILIKKLNAPSCGSGRDFTAGAKFGSDGEEKVEGRVVVESVEMDKVEDRVEVEVEVIKKVEDCVELGFCSDCCCCCCF